MTPHELDRLGIDERKLVERHLRDSAKTLPLMTQEITPALRLAAINAAIWERENRLRELEHRGDGNDTDTFCKTVVQIAFEIIRLNDWRAKITGEEKLR